MKHIIAIQADHSVNAHGPQSFSDQWLRLLAERPGFDVRMVDVRDPHVVDRLKGVTAFMWRFHGSDSGMLEIAKRLLPVAENILRIPVFPPAMTPWFAWDKAAQYFLLSAAKIPQVATWVFFKRSDALSFAQNADYPLVFKLPSGRQSQDVQLVRSSQRAVQVVNAMFGNGVHGLWELTGSAPKRAFRHFAETAAFLAGRPVHRGRQDGVALFQEFLDGNAFDTRITVIGRYAFGFRRLNRPGDFRASGSGLLDWDPDAVETSAVLLAFETARAIGNHFLAVDILTKEGMPVVCELNFSYQSWAVAKCRGCWYLSYDADPADPAGLQWVDPAVSPEELTLTEFLHLAGLDSGDTDSAQAARDKHLG